MFLWILAFVLLALFGLYGLKRGGIRGGITLLGLVIALLVCGPLGRLLSPALTAAGYKHPVVQLFLGPAVAFVAIMIIASVISYFVQEKVEFQLKYFSDDIGRARFERLNAQLGLCSGLLNAIIYFFVLIMPFYIFGYFTFQAAGSQASAKLKLATEIRKEMHSARLDKVAAGFDPAPPELYDASDVLGLIVHNRLLENRIFRYPPFLTLAERPEFQELLNDAQFQTLFQSGNSQLQDLAAHPKVKEMMSNLDLYQAINSALGPNLKDLKEFLETGHSPKFDDEKILGLWGIDLQKTVDADKKKRGNMSFTQARANRAQILTSYPNALLIATTDNQLILKAGQPGPNGAIPLQNKGSWQKSAAGGYTYSLGAFKGEVMLSGGELKVDYKGYPLIFTKEN